MFANFCRGRGEDPAALPYAIDKGLALENLIALLPSATNKKRFVRDERREHTHVLFHTIQSHSHCYMNVIACPNTPKSTSF